MVVMLLIVLKNDLSFAFRIKESLSYTKVGWVLAPELPIVDSSSRSVTSRSEGENNN